jgi:predicted TPR repeat methyltransferase
LLADRRFEWARDCESKGDLAAATDLMQQALELVPQFAPAWFALGEIRERSGDRDGAVEAYRQARKADPEDRHGALLPLMRLGAAPPAAMPPAYLRTLFDQYAPAFDAALVEGLGYRAPALLRACVERECAKLGRPLRFGSMLDLGCGTGLAGVAFRSCIDWMVGVDISPAMIAQAKMKVIYDRLHAAELAGFMCEEIAAGARHHLIVSADVFVYFSDLAPAFACVAELLAPDGLFAFTVETHDGAGVVLQETRRFAHSPDYVRRVIEQSGLSPLTLERASTRREKQVDVPGLVAMARRG